MEFCEVIEILSENIEKEILERMPEWFRVLKDYYSRRNL